MHAGPKSTRLVAHVFSIGEVAERCNSARENARPAIRVFKTIDRVTTVDGSHGLR